MSHITLNDEQVCSLSNSEQPIEVRDSRGTLLGYLQPSLDALMIARVKKRQGTKRKMVSSDQVHSVLQKLDEADSAGASKEELQELAKKLVDEV